MVAFDHFKDFDVFINYHPGNSLKQVGEVSIDFIGM